MAALAEVYDHSTLYLRKGRCGGSGAYRGAHWHTRREIRALFDAAGIDAPRIGTAVVLASGSRIARALEGRLPGGAFFAIIARKPAS